VCVCVYVNYECRPIECNSSGYKYETRTVQTATKRNGLFSSKMGTCSGMLKARIMINIRNAVDYYKADSPKVCRRSVPQAGL